MVRQPPRFGPHLVFSPRSEDNPHMTVFRDPGGMGQASAGLAAADIGLETVYMILEVLYYYGFFTTRKIVTPREQERALGTSQEVESGGELGRLVSATMKPDHCFSLLLAVISISFG